jgi:hypothetical protein
MTMGSEAGPTLHWGPRQPAEAVPLSTPTIVCGSPRTFKPCAESGLLERSRMCLRKRPLAESETSGAD